ncbi:hypothetical protein BKA62DRAFT_483451 [Auriculariales sp. MPI-PUGE-AT-0066]|nr:hypothetical protein BKA62DRAFT_483451 [Auriculariales sp. MPI-PUGE-AT-0066]
MLYSASSSNNGLVGTHRSSVSLQHPAEMGMASPCISTGFGQVGHRRVHIVSVCDSLWRIVSVPIRLLVFLFDLDRRMCVVSMGLTILIGSLHLVSVFLPLWFGDCPTTTPVLNHLRWIGEFFMHFVKRLWVYSITAASQLRQQVTRFLPARWFPREREGLCSRI